jgi:hypothetical protein
MASVVEAVAVLQAPLRCSNCCAPIVDALVKLGGLVEHELHCCTIVVTAAAFQAPSRRCTGRTWSSCRT